MSDAYWDEQGRLVGTIRVGRQPEPPSPRDIPPPPPGFMLVGAGPGASDVPPPPPGFTLIGGAGMPQPGRAQFDAAFSRAPDVSPQQDAALKAGAEAAMPSVGGSAARSALHGFSFGFDDEGAGILAGAKAILDGGDPMEAFNNAVASARRTQELDRARNPIASTVGEIGGAIATAPLTGGLGVAARGAGLGARIGAGIRSGAITGTAYGAGEAQGNPIDRLDEAATGAAIGAGAGATFPLAGAAVKAVGKPVIDAVRARVNPAGFASQKITERVGDMQQAEARIARAAQNGQSMALADVGGDSARKLLRTAANVPGPGQNAVYARANLSAAAQGDRIKRIVSDVFANPEGAYQAAKASIMDARSKAAKPYYDAAYKRNVPFSFQLEELLQTPAGKAGLAAAKKNTANRREPWAHFFANIADDGTIVDLKRVPDTRALDEVKRVLDRMVEAAKAAPDGSPFAKARATPESMAIQSVRDDLVGHLKEFNPAYRKALEVAGDNIRADEALEFGRNALKTDARINAARMGTGAKGREKALDEGERELARIGLAEAIRETVDKAGFTHNALLKFFGSRELIARVRPFFRSEADWKSFREAMINEARKAKTANAVRGNSTTASQLLDAQDAGALREGVGIVSDVAKQGVIPAVISAAVRGIQRLGGITPEVAAEIGRQLQTRDPAEVAKLVSRVKAIEGQRLDRQQTVNRIQAVLSAFIGGRLSTEQARPPTLPPGAR